MVGSDVDRLTAVLDLLEKRKLRASEVTVGDIHIVLARAPAKEPAPAKVLSKDEAELARMRKEARKLFGRSLPDEALKEMAGAL